MSLPHPLLEVVTLMVVALLCQTWSAWNSGHTADQSYSVVTLMVVALLCQTQHEAVNILLTCLIPVSILICSSPCLPTPNLPLLEMVILVVVSDMVCMKQWTYCWLILFCGHSDGCCFVVSDTVSMKQWTYCWPILFCGHSDGCCFVVSDMVSMKQWTYCWLILFCGHSDGCCFVVSDTVSMKQWTYCWPILFCGHSDGCCFVVSDTVSMKQWTYCWPILFCGHSDGCCFVVSDTVSMKQWTYCWPILFCGHWWMVTLMVVALLCQTWSAWSSGHTAETWGQIAARSWGSHSLGALPWGKNSNNSHRKCSV